MAGEVGGGADIELTLREAASNLGVSPQRVSQLLREGRLTGTDYGPGRAPKDVPRVHRSSVQDYARTRRATRRAGKVLTDGLETRVADLEQRLADRDRELREAALVLKAGAGQLRDELTRKIEENKELRLEQARLAVELNSALEQMAADNTLHQTHSDALTTLLGPRSPGDL